MSIPYNVDGPAACAAFGANIYDREVTDARFEAFCKCQECSAEAASIILTPVRMDIDSDELTVTVGALLTQHEIATQHSRLPSHQQCEVQSLARADLQLLSLAR